MNGRQVGKTTDSSVSTTLTASSTNHVYLKDDGNVEINTTGVDPTGSTKIWEVTTDGTGTTAESDERVFTVEIDEDVKVQSLEAIGADAFIKGGRLDLVKLQPYIRLEDTSLDGEIVRLTNRDAKIKLTNDGESVQYLTYDITNKRFGVNTDSPAEAVDVVGSIKASVSLIGPLLIGGTAPSSTLILRSTSGVGSSDAIIFQVGNNGATEAGRFTTAGVLQPGVDNTQNIGTNILRWSTMFATSFDVRNAASDANANARLVASGLQLGPGGASEINTTIGSTGPTTVALIQNSVSVLVSDSAGAVANTLYLKTGLVGIGTTTPDYVADGNTVLTVRGDTAGKTGALELVRTGAAAATTGIMGRLTFAGLNGGTSMVSRAGIQMELDGATNSTLLSFETMSAGVFSEKMHLTSAGHLRVGTAADVTTSLGKTVVVNASSVEVDSGFIISTNRADADAALLGGLRGWFASATTVGGEFRHVASIDFLTSGATVTKRGGAIRFSTQPDNVAGVVEVGRFTPPGQLQLPVQGSTGGLLIGSDAPLIYRSAAGQLSVSREGETALLVESTGVGTNASIAAKALTTQQANLAVQSGTTSYGWFVDDDFESGVFRLLLNGSTELLKVSTVGQVLLPQATAFATGLAFGGSAAPRFFSDGSNYVIALQGGDSSGTPVLRLKRDSSSMTAQIRAQAKDTAAALIEYAGINFDNDANDASSVRGRLELAVARGAATTPERGLVLRNSKEGGSFTNKLIVLYSAPANVAPDDAIVDELSSNSSTVATWVDETNNLLKWKIRYTDTAYKTGEVSLGGYITTDLLTAANVKFKSGTSFIGTLDHGITEDRTWTLPNFAGYVGITGSMSIPAAAAIIPLSGGAQQVTVDGTNFDYVVCDFDQTTAEEIIFQFNAPNTLRGGDVTVILYWVSTATSGTARWLADYRVANAGTAYDGTFTTGSNVETDTDSTAGEVNSSSITLTTPWTRGDSVILRIKRDAGHANDDLAADARLLKVEVRFNE